VPSIDRILGIVGVVLAVVGLVAAWYFYRASLPTRIPTFLVDPVRATLVDRSDSASDITIFYKGHPIGPRAVNVVRIYFWNGGNTPIMKTDVLQTLAVEVTGTSEILDTKILQVSRTLTGVAFSPQGGAPNSAAVTFDLLEPDDGAALQIIYAGPRDAELKFSGVTIGAAQPTILSPNVPYQKIVRQLSPWLGMIARFAGVLAYVFIFFAFAVQMIAMTPPAGRFVYRRIFRSQQTDDEIEESARRILPYAMGVMMVGVAYLVLVPANPLQGQVPAALILSS